MFLLKILKKEVSFVLVYSIGQSIVWLYTLRLRLIIYVLPWLWNKIYPFSSYPVSDQAIYQISYQINWTVYEFDKILIDHHHRLEKQVLEGLRRVYLLNKNHCLSRRWTWSMFRPLLNVTWLLSFFFE